jgi:hypothetical protein
MTTTYEKIATTTLGSTTSTITFSSISSAYTDLILIGSWFRVTTSGNNVGMRLNSDSGSNYSNTNLEGNGSSASSTRQTNDTYARIGAIQGGYTASTTESLPIIIQFNNYSNTTTKKTILSRYNQASVVTGAAVALWRSTSAINAIELNAYSPGTGQFGAGSTFTLYGIKAE